MELEIREFMQRALEAAQRAGISPAQVSARGSEQFKAGVREGKLEVYEVSDSVSVTLRGKCAPCGKEEPCGACEGRIGTASTQALDEESLDMLVRGVKESAELIETDEQDEILPPDERYGRVDNYSEEVERLTPQEKIALAFEIDERLCAADRRLKADQSVVVTAAETYAMLNTLGLDLSHRSNLVYAYTGALAREDGDSASGFKLLWGYGADVVKAQDVADGCAEDALSKLHAGRLASGAYAVVIRNGAMADLLTTFCGIFSADNAQQGLSLLAGREGETIASACVTLTDDPLLPWGLGSSPFDREGAATRRKQVIERGVLRTLLHNRKTAKKAGCRTTGNAAGGGRVAPSNLFFAPGDASPEALMERMGDGLYLTEVTGLHAGANAVSGDFSLLSRGFEVKGGKAVRPVEQFTVAGNFYQLLKDIEAVGGDLLFEGSPVGSPSVLVRRLSVAGE